MAYSPELLDRLESLDPAPWSGTAYRYTAGGRSPESENTQGARWNPPEVAAIYVALDRETLLAEFEYHLAALSPRPRRSAFTLYSLRLEVENVLELRSPDLLLELGITPEALADDDHLRCREVGGAAAYLHSGGILVPSARRDKGTNLVIYPHHQNAGYAFDTLSKETIPG